MPERMDFSRMMRLTHEGRAEGFEGLTALASEVFMQKTWAYGPAQQLQQAFSLLTVHGMTNQDAVQCTKIRNAIKDCQTIIGAEIERLKDLPVNPDCFGEETGIDGVKRSVQYGSDPQEEARAFCNKLEGMKLLMADIPDTIDGQSRVVETHMRLIAQ